MISCKLTAADDLLPSRWESIDPAFLKIAESVTALEGYTIHDQGKLVGENGGKRIEFYKSTAEVVICDYVNPIMFSH